MPSGRRAGSSISLCEAWQLAEALTQLQVGPLQGAGERILPGITPSFMGCNPSTEWVTGGKGTHGVGGQWALMCASLSL